MSSLLFFSNVTEVKFCLQNTKAPIHIATEVLNEANRTVYLSHTGAENIHE